jgi:signal transduction histidine kinase
VYSDESRLIGRHQGLPPEKRDVLRAGTGSGLFVSELDEPERDVGDRHWSATQVYVPVTGPQGEPMLWESYVVRDTATTEAGSLMTTFAVSLFTAAGLALAAQGVVAVHLARRLDHGKRDRVLLLQRASEASHAERRRIARDLHDGIVQDLTGIALDLTTPPPPIEDASSAMPFKDEVAQRLRRSIRELRSLIPYIYPVDLRNVGLPSAIASLVSRERATAVTTLDIDDDLALERDTERLLYRAVQEAVRNVDTHAHATNVTVSLHREDSTAVLVVADNGRGFASDGYERATGHVGLRLLAEMAEAVGGDLDVQSIPGQGTTLTMRVPV